MKHFVVGVDWYGPYVGHDNASARKVAALDAAHWAAAGLYCAVGRSPEDGEEKPLYFGLSNNLAQRLRGHRGLDYVEQRTNVAQLWLGYPATAEQSGRRGRVHPRTLTDAEWCHIYFMRPPFNERRTEAPPLQPVTILNRWWTVDGEPREARPHESWPDLFDYMGDQRRTKVVWFDGRVEEHDLHLGDMMEDALS